MKERSTLLCIFGLRFQLLDLMDVLLTTTDELWQRTVLYAVGMQYSWCRVLSCKGKEPT